LCRLERDEIADLLECDFPTADRLYRVGPGDLEPLLAHLVAYRRSGSVPASARDVPPEKLAYNQLSHEDRDDFVQAMRHAPLVEDYYQARSDVTERDEVAEGFSAYYRDLRHECQDSAEIIWKLQEYVTGNARQSREQERAVMVLGEQRATLLALRHRYEAAQALESTRREITQARLTLQEEMNRDIDERRPFVDEATILFAEFANELYGPERTAYLRFEAAPSNLRIEPHIQSDNSGRISSMVLFCFDLTFAVLAHRAGRAPDFLIHDSHLFDGVDERQLAAGLSLAARVVEREGM
jgi:hypothetical protein